MNQRRYGHRLWQRDTPGVYEVIPTVCFSLAAEDHGDGRLLIFFTQVMLLVVVGRLLGEGMQRVGQPAVVGQLLAGIVLGPSVFGTVWPAAQQLIFPTAAS